MIHAPKDSSDGLILAIEAFGAPAFRELISKATTAKLHYLTSQGIKLGRPEKLTGAECAEIDRLEQLSGYHPRLIAEELSAQRLAAIPEGLEEDERKKAERHATVSRSIVYRYQSLSGSLNPTSRTSTG